MFQIMLQPKHHEAMSAMIVSTLCLLFIAFCESLNVQFHYRMNFPCSIALKISSPI
jgi:uncharacterized membrane protein YesL